MQVGNELCDVMGFYGLQVGRAVSGKAVQFPPVARDRMAGVASFIAQMVEVALYLGAHGWLSGKQMAEHFRNHIGDVVQEQRVHIMSEVCGVAAAYGEEAGKI